VVQVGLDARGPCEYGRPSKQRSELTRQRRDLIFWRKDFPVEVPWFLRPVESDLAVAYGTRVTAASPASAWRWRVAVQLQ
jgi:hypothetical protein